MKLASYNVENLFERAVAMNQDTWADGRKALTLHAEMNGILGKTLYTNADRARIVAIIYVMVIAVTTPFGWISGELSSISKVLPFVMNIALFAAGALLVLRAAKYSKKQSALALAAALQTAEEV